MCELCFHDYMRKNHINTESNEETAKENQVEKTLKGGLHTHTQHNKSWEPKGAPPRPPPPRNKALLRDY